MRLEELFMNNEKIIVQTRREANLLADGLIALMNNAYQAKISLNGECNQADNAIDEYTDELRELLEKIKCLEKESDE